MIPGGKKIFVVDDDADFLYQLKINLEKSGYDVTSADNRAEAEKIIDKWSPDLAIIDLMMESEDSGFVLCHRFKKKYPQIPVIILTSVAVETGISFNLKDDSNHQWIKADAILDKGLKPEKLRAEMERLLLQK